MQDREDRLMRHYTAHKSLDQPVHLRTNMKASAS